MYAPTLFLVFVLITHSTVGHVILPSSISKALVPVTLTNERCASDFSSKSIAVIFGLQQRNLDQLESIFWNVSTPSHPSYGKHLSFEELHSLIEPHPNALMKIKEWLIINGVRTQNISVLPARDHMRVHMTIGLAEKIFNTKYQLYKDLETDKFVLKPRHYEVPETLGIRAVFSRAFVEVPRRCAKTVNVPETASNEIKHDTKRSAPNYVDRELTDVISSSNAPWPIANFGFQIMVALRCPDGSYAGYNLVCANGQRLTTILVTAYNYNTKAFVRTDTYSTASAVLCGTNSYICEFKVQSWPGLSLNPYLVYYLQIQPNYNLPNFTPLYFSYVGQTDAGILSNNITLPYLPTSGYVGLSISAIKSLYGVNSVATNPNNSQGVIEFFNAWYSPSDLSGFFAQEGLPDYSSKVISTGVPNCGCAVPAGESQLDIELIMAIGANVTTYFYEDSSIDDTDWLCRAINQPTGYALVQSLSYGFDDELPALTAYYDIEFMKAGARGISLLAASGDSGMWADINQDYGPSQVVLAATEPVSSPFVTTVGATMVNFNGVGLEEWVCSSKFGAQFTGGMGLSSYQPRPWYQDAAANNYYTNYVGTVPPSFNISKRAYPDVSAVGLNINNFINGAYTVISGTSASAPIFAGIVALLNDIRLNANLPPLGFLTPLLYSLPSDAFNDVVFGDSACVPQYCGPFGFPAAPGYDLPSGLGTPNFQKLSQYISALGNNLPSSVLSTSTASKATVVSSATSSFSASSISSSSSTTQSASTSSLATSSSTILASTSSSSVSSAIQASTSTSAASLSSTSSLVATTSAASVASTSSSSVSSGIQASTSTSAASVASTSSSSVSSGIQASSSTSAASLSSTSSSSVSSGIQASSSTTSAASVASTSSSSVSSGIQASISLAAVSTSNVVANLASTLSAVVASGIQASSSTSAASLASTSSSSVSSGIQASSSSSTTSKATTRVTVSSTSSSSSVAKATTASTSSTSSSAAAVVSSSSSTSFAATSSTAQAGQTIH